METSKNGRIDACQYALVCDEQALEVVAFTCKNDDARPAMLRIADQEHTFPPGYDGRIEFEPRIPYTVSTRTRPDGKTITTMELAYRVRLVG